MPRNMGIGKLGEPHLVFVRQFRWTLKGKYLSESWNKSVNVFHHSKELMFTAYEVFDKNNTVPIIEWAEKMEGGEYQDEELVLTTYDGCGYELYAYKFSGLKIRERSTYFDYATSDVAMQRINLLFNKCERIPVTDSKHAPVVNRETEINFLNAKTWLDKEPKTGVPFHEFKPLNKEKND